MKVYRTSEQIEKTARRVAGEAEKAARTADLRPLFQRLDKTRKEADVADIVTASAKQLAELAQKSLSGAAEQLGTLLPRPAPRHRTSLPTKGLVLTFRLARKGLSHLWRKLK